MNSPPNTPSANAAMAQSRFEKSPRPRPGTGGRAIPNTDFEIGPRVTWPGACQAYERKPHDPLFRPLRIYALDPAASVLDGALSVVNVPYEPIERGPGGPRGAILEIVSGQSAQGDNSECVDLNDPFLLMQQGRMQAPEDRLFQQQMVYAVCMTTYASFRHALGRDITWGFRHLDAANGGSRLRIRPAVRDLENAFYDRTLGQLSFGEFTASGTVAGRNVPRGRISLCLSHDVVVHEMSHALLDALRSHFLFPSNPDVLAFHEAFADLMAVFQRFTYRDVVLAAVRGSHGDLTSAQLLIEIGVQFAEATCCAGALRTAVGGTKLRYEDTFEPHTRGEVLVAAVFEAFTVIFGRRVAPLLRLSTGGTGMLPPGAIPEILAAQLAEQASRLAAQLMTICIRAIDYCPPVDITFGEFLRAVITADVDVVPLDTFGYREAWIEAFAKYRIYPEDVPSLSEQALRWSAPEETVPPQRDLSFARLHFDRDPTHPAGADEILRQAKAFGKLAADRRFRREFGLAAPGDPSPGGDEVKLPVVQSIRPSRRVGPSGQVVFDLVAEITQRRIVKPRRQGEQGFEFIGGATAIIGPKGHMRLIIRKSVTDADRVNAQRGFLNSGGNQYFGRGPGGVMLPQPKLLLRLHESTRPASQTKRAFFRDLAMPEAGQPQSYLLRNGANAPAVTLLKACLNRCLQPRPNLDSTATFDSATEQAVYRLQGSAGIAIDGIIGQVSWSILGRSLNYVTNGLPIGPEIPSWIIRLLTNNPATARLTGLEPPTALELYQASHGPMTPSQRNGFSFLLDSMKADAQIKDLRWAAYMLATVQHECAQTWQPIEESGRGTGKPYGKPVPAENQVGSPQFVYYGRGYVQLTWRDNYQKLGYKLNMGNSLMLHPESALDPDIAYQVMSVGMRSGLFTGARLETYINGPNVDYENARRIINGLDEAPRIAGYAGDLEVVLLGSVQ